ncbi:MAG: efflux transporter outer membrane subunit [Verrucomicrobiales bacterium]
MKIGIGKIVFSASTSAILLAGCTMAPKYERPAPPVASIWPKTLTATTNDPGATIADIHWNDFFKEPRLQQLIDRGLRNNRDLRIATLRVEQARAFYRIERAALLPNLDAGSSFTRQRTPATISQTGGSFTTSTYDVSLGASYELDLFGRVRSLKNEALERFFATEEARNTVYISLVSEIASQYLTILQLQESRRLAEETQKAVQASFELNRKSFEAGASSELDLRTADAQVQAAKVNVAQFQQLLSQAENNLEFLLGEPFPQNLPAGAPLREQALLGDLPIGLPSDLLIRRPDIRAAEHQLKAANANIGAARAAFFPRILLTGSGGTVSAELSDLFTGPSAAWRFAPSITVPIFSGGRNRATLNASELGKQIEVANYERTIQNAFREVSDALAVRAVIDAQLQAQTLLVQAQQRRFDLTDVRYRQGIDSYVAVLLAQQDLYASQQNLLQFQAARLINAVTLYRALGGGWQPTGPATENQPVTQASAQ